MTTNDMPADVQRTLYRALVWSRAVVSEDEQSAAWKWLDENTPPYEEMGS